MPPESPQLVVTETEARNGERYQCLEIVMAGAIEPAVLSSLALPANLDYSRGIVLWGRGPVWLYAHLTSRCEAASWVGAYDVRLGSFVVVASRQANMQAGDLCRLVNRDECAAILIGGPPDSGKSVLANALAKHLRERQGRKAQLIRAHWDGEGDWYAEMRNRPLAAELRNRGKSKGSGRFFYYQASAVSNTREVAELVLVDFGGIPKPDDISLLHRCTHYILIASDDSALPSWDRFCRVSGGLTPLAIVHSVREPRVEIIRTEPYLEVIAGPWDRGSDWLPDALLERVDALATR